MTAIITTNNSSLAEFTILPNNRHILVTHFQPEFDKYLDQPYAQALLNAKSSELGIPIFNTDNRSNKQPNALIFYHRKDTYAHPEVTLQFFAIHKVELYSSCLKFINSKTYPFSPSERTQLYRPLEQGHLPWKKTFGDAFFSALYKFHKMENKGESYQHPLFFAGYINLLVYSLIPVDKSHLIPKELKILRECDNCTSFSTRMHQYLDEDARIVLLTTINRATDLLEFACLQSDDLATRKMFLKQRIDEITSGQIPLNIYSYWSNNKQLKGVN